MPKRLSEAEIERFRRDGVLFPLKALEREEAAEGMRRLEAMEARRAGRLPPALNAKPHLLLPWLWDLVHDPRILDPVEDLLGPDILCWGTSFISKQAREPRYVAWHQDATYWGLSSPEAVTAWVALTPSTPKSGGVRAIPGSHREQIAHRDTGDPANLLGLRERIAVEVDEARAVDLTLDPGEMSLHHVLVVHGSAPNQSGARRVGFAIRYIPGRVAQAGGARNSATLARGRDHGHFDLERRPLSDFDPAAMARHPEILRRGMAILFSGARNARR